MTTIRTTRLTLLSLVALGLCGLTLFLFPVVSPAAPTISWTPKNLSEIVAQGASINIPVSFRSGKNLSNVTFRVVPEISPYVSVTPSSIASIAKNETVVVTVSFSPDEDAPIDTFDGTVHVRAGTSARTYAKPLPVTVQILEKLPGSVEPDPDMVVTDPKGGVYPVNQVLMLPVDGATRADIEDVAVSVDGTLVGHLAEINIYQLEVPTATIAELNSVMADLEGDSRVTAAGTNALYVQQGTFPTDLDNLWKSNPSYLGAYDRIRIREAWDRIEQNLNTEARRVVVGIVDPVEIFCKHPEFVNVSILDPGVSCTDNLTADSHGTGVAGIIGANNISPNYEYPHMNGILSGFSKSNYALRLTNSSSSFRGGFELFQMTTWDAINNQCGDERDPPHVVNLSMKNTDPGSFSEWGWTNLFEACNDSLFVAAAGNDGVDASNNQPGGGIQAVNLISVAATSLSDQRAGSDDWASNYGDSVDIAAPEQVYAPGVPDGAAKYFFLDKTSSATPLVAGVAAMLMSIDPQQRSPKKIKEVLLRTANPIDPYNPAIDGAGLGKQLGCSNSDPKPKGCRLNAERAVCAILDLDCVTYSFTPESKSVNENAGTVSFMLNRSDSSTAQTVYVSTVQDQGSTNEGDYVGKLNEAVSFAAGDASPQTVTVTINDDVANPVVEPEERFTLVVEDAPDGNVLASATFTIFDDDAASPTVLLEDFESYPLGALAEQGEDLPVTYGLMRGSLHHYHIIEGQHLENEREGGGSASWIYDIATSSQLYSTSSNGTISFELAMPDNGYGFGGDGTSLNNFHIGYWTNVQQTGGDTFWGGICMQDENEPEWFNIWVDDDPHGSCIEGGVAWLSTVQYTLNDKVVVHVEMDYASTTAVVTLNGDVESPAIPMDGPGYFGIGGLGFSFYEGSNTQLDNIITNGGPYGVDAAPQPN